MLLIRLSLGGVRRGVCWTLLQVRAICRCFCCSFFGLDQVDRRFNVRKTISHGESLHCWDHNKGRELLTRQVCDKKTLETLMKNNRQSLHARHREVHQQQPEPVPLAPPTLATLTQNDKGACCAWIKDGLPCVEPGGTTTAVASTPHKEKNSDPVV